jgi:hypothetical protein
MCPLPYVGPLEVDLWVSGTPSVTDTVYLNVGTLSFCEDCESGENGWVHSGTPDLWNLTSYRSYSGSYSWYFGGETSRRYPNNADGSLTSESLLAGEGSTLSFWVWYEVSTYGVDGIFVILFRNGVPDTLDFIGSGGALASGPWDTLITKSDWVEWEKTLDEAVPGDTLQISFGFVSDADTVAEGVYIDDMCLTGLVPVTTGIADETSLTCPARIVVSPNPACEGIQLIATADGELAIDIYNIQGRICAEVIKPPGQPSVRWNLKNRYGHRVAPGVYMARTRGPTQADVTKIVVLR